MTKILCMCRPLHIFIARINSIIHHPRHVRLCILHSFPKEFAPNIHTYFFENSGIPFSFDFNDFWKWKKLEKSFADQFGLEMETHFFENNRISQ